MIETPLAVLSIAAIAAASEMTRLAAFVLGFNDLAKEMRAPLTPGRTPYLPVLTQTVLAARAHGLSVLDGVWNAIEDMQGFRSEERRVGKEGFSACRSRWSPYQKKKKKM